MENLMEKYLVERIRIEVTDDEDISMFVNNIMSDLKKVDMARNKKSIQLLKDIKIDLDELYIYFKRTR